MSEDWRECVAPISNRSAAAMNPPTENAGLALNISAVEREAGLSKDVLRMWERRYGFPKPFRDDNGERRYSVAEVAKLRAIKRLMDVGLRPGKIIHHTLDELNALAEGRIAARREQATPAAESEILALLSGHDAPALQNLFANLLMRQGLQRFVLETLASLNHAVGEAWMRGELAVFEEHLYTEQLQVALRTGINAFPRQVGAPRMLLTTFPGEQHGLGLLMVEALLVPEGAQCISLGAQTPIEDIRRAAVAHDVHIVALSFSGAFPVRQAGDGLAALRRQLPARIAVWAGGEMTRRVRKSLPGVTLVPDIGATAAALKAWRTRVDRDPIDSALRSGALIAAVADAAQRGIHSRCLEDHRRQTTTPKSVGPSATNWHKSSICGLNPSRKWSRKPVFMHFFADPSLRRCSPIVHHSLSVKKQTKVRNGPTCPVRVDYSSFCDPARHGVARRSRQAAVTANGVALGAERGMQQRQISMSR